jgi:uncharacterized Zn-finger protein
VRLGDYCGKAFTSRNILRRHVLLHQGLRPYACRVCGNVFAQAETLRTHQWLVHKMLPYECDVCHQQFKIKNQLKLHRAEHWVKDNIPAPS